MTYRPTTCDTWRWNGHTGCVEFKVDRLDDQMRQVESSFNVRITEEFLEDTFDPPVGLDPLGVAKQHHDRLEDIAMARASAGQHDEHGTILITSL